MKLHIPNSAFIGNIDPFLRGINFSNPNELILTANENWISVHPIVLSLIAALGLPIEPAHIHCEKLTAKSAHYLERMGLFKFLGIDSGMNISEHESAGRFVPLTQIKNSDELSAFITEMIPLLHLEPIQTNSIRYVISELVRNVLEHAQSKNGAIVSAQYHTRSNMIRIGIADTGLGIKKTISRSHIVHTDLEAIRLALIPGITGTTSKEGGTEFNAGAGLFFTKSIATVNHDYFMIYSGTAMYKLLKSRIKKLNADPFNDRHSSAENYPYFQGTAVGIDISLNETQEFANLLSLIRTTYSQTVRDRKKARYKKRPQFI
ncbi:MAG: hypothetical protein HYV41_05605 [Candidatus Magasanikbacteria bacterium]|nr:hypothetical protein [Candidatus Magasanikbacteria bacterium]